MTCQHYDPSQDVDDEPNDDQPAAGSSTDPAPPVDDNATRGIARLLPARDPANVTMVVLMIVVGVVVPLVSIAATIAAGPR